MLDYTDYFAATYVAARQKFQESVRGASGTLQRHLHPGARGLLGEELTIDVGHVGNTNAPRQLLMISGTHGLEGFAGSALQVACLRHLNETILAADIGVLMVHGLNPYGFSHGSRTTENGVDLNRNFIDHDTPSPANAGYAELHPHLVPPQWSGQTRQDADAAVAAFRAMHGEDAMFDTYARGQFQYPDGVFFGGSAREWSNLTLEFILNERFARAAKVAVIDWHTGIGEYGRPFFMSFAEDASEEQRQAALWWGSERVLGSRPHGRARPNYQGLVFHGVQAFLPGRTVTGAVIEFGTRGPAAGEVAIRQDQWLRHHAADVSQDAYALLKADLLDSLNPVSYQWRDSVLQTGLDAMSAAIHGLSRW